MLDESVTTHSYYVELHGKLRVESDELESIFDPLIDAFDGLAGISDVDLGINLRDRLLSISMYLDAASQTDAINLGISAARTAIHETGGHTPGWTNATPDLDDFASSVRRADLIAY